MKRNTRPVIVDDWGSKWR